MSDVKSWLYPTAGMNKNFLNYLLETNLDPSLHMPCLRTVLTCQQTENLKSVFRRLSTEGVLSCPVLDSTSFKGFLTLFDIVNFITNMNWGKTGEEWSAFFSNSREFNDATVADVMETPLWTGGQNADPLYTFNSTFHALEKLAITGGHRAAVIDRSTQRVVNIMTQSMLISEIKQRIRLLPTALRTMRVRAMTEYFTSVRVVNETDTAMNAYIQMRDADVCGLGIVDCDGVLIGSISVQDLRGIGVDGPFFSRLFRTVKDFKAAVAHEYPELGPRAHSYLGKTPCAARCVHDDMTFEDVINKMSDGCIHRVFVCSAESIRIGRPMATNILTQTNVLKQVLKYYATPAEKWQCMGRG
jgi:CBS-domain-containing membrane protein